MKFAAASLALLSLAASSHAAPSARADSDRCKSGTSNVQKIADDYQPWATQLLKPCLSGLNAGGTNVLARRACLAAAVAMSPAVVSNYASCDIPALPDRSALPYLDYSAWAGIVGGCAYDTPACGISRQNMVDLVYSELSKAGATTWPSNTTELLDDVIGPVFTWAAREPTIEYKRFNAFLLVSPGPDVFGDRESKAYYYDHENDSDFYPN